MDIGKDEGELIVAFSISAVLIFSIVLSVFAVLGVSS